jgi:hypothetical protein
MRELKQTQIYPHISSSGKPIDGIFPITNTFDGTTINLAGGLSTSFNTSAPTNGTDLKPCFKNSFPTEAVLLGVDFTLDEGGVTALVSGKVTLVVDGNPIEQQFTAGTGLQTFSFACEESLSIGSAFSIRVSADLGSFKPFSLTAIIKLV